MNGVTRLKVGPVAVLVLLALLAVLVVHRRGLTAGQAEGEVVGTAAQLEDAVARDQYAAVAFVALVAVFGFVTWAALRARKGAGQAMPPAEESSASDKTVSR
jgi:hypothetical protein